MYRHVFRPDGWQGRKRVALVNRQVQRFFPDRRELKRRIVIEFRYQSHVQAVIFDHLQHVLRQVLDHRDPHAREENAEQG